MSNRMFLRSILVGSSLLAAAAAQAAPTATFNVTANVLQTCTVAATDLAFGNINVVQNIEFDATSQINLTCGEGVTYNVGLDAGQGAGGTTTTRVMTNQSVLGATLNYALYQDDVHTLNWGNTDHADTEQNVGSGVQQTLTVYGAIPAGQQNAAYGSYADVINVNVYY